VKKDPSVSKFAPPHHTMPPADYEKLIQLLKSALDVVSDETCEADPSLWKLRKRILDLLLAVKRAEQKPRRKPKS
jgi:hypothetical protein